MTDYVIQILFTDQRDALMVELPGVDLEEAEAFTAQLRYDVEEAKDIDAPLVEATVPGAAGTPLDLDPRHVRSIDLEESHRGE